ncbi:MAG: hypothetical protein LBD23_16395 [Oscillospiraceae bacterium]|jgi:hypothetical protein|nr:hypothetical protein [Oscillospiraceae bacterium]
MHKESKEKGNKRFVFNALNTIICAAICMIVGAIITFYLYFHDPDKHCKDCGEEPCECEINTVCEICEKEPCKCETDTVNTLISITPPTEITRNNGVERTAIGLGLPAMVTIETSDGNMQASITWDLDSFVYNPAIVTAQPFIAKGIITLPEDVENPDNISLEVKIPVIVDGTPNVTDREIKEITPIDTTPPPESLLPESHNQSPRNDNPIWIQDEQNYYDDGDYIYNEDGLYWENESYVFYEDGSYWLNEYAPNMNLLRSIGYNPDGSIWVVYVYDANGNLFNLMRFYSDDVVHSQTIYNVDGNIINRDEYYEDGSIKIHEIYKYDFYRKISEMTSYYYGIEFNVLRDELAYYVVHEYDEYGNLKLANFYFPNDVWFDTYYY